MEIIRSYNLFSPCFFIYLCCTFPGLWILESDRFEIFNDILNRKVNGSEINNMLTEIYGVTLPFELDKDTWVRVLEQFLLVLIFIGRWLLPHRALSQDQLSTVILIYIGPAFDVMELLIIFEEPVVRNDVSLSLAIFIVWTVSFLQFTLLLSLNGKQQEAASDESENDGCCMCCDYEVLGLIIYTLLMDIPFFVVRMYAIITHQLFKDGLILFAAKNFVVIFFTMYRVSVKCITLKRHSPTKESSRDTALPGVVNMAFIPEDVTDQTEDPNKYSLHVINDNNKCSFPNEATGKTEDNIKYSVSDIDNDNRPSQIQETDNVVIDMTANQMAVLSADKTIKSLITNDCTDESCKHSNDTEQNMIDKPENQNVQVDNADTRESLSQDVNTSL